MNPPALWLASRSPRRAELLRTLGVSFAPLDVEVDEGLQASEPAADYVARLARAKAAAGLMVAPFARASAGGRHHGGLRRRDSR
jgi:septum formation protein